MRGREPALLADLLPLFAEHTAARLSRGPQHTMRGREPAPVEELLPLVALPRVALRRTAHRSMRGREPAPLVELLPLITLLWIVLRGSARPLDERQRTRTACGIAATRRADADWRFVGPHVGR